MATKEEKKHQYSESTLSLINFVIRPPRVDNYDEAELNFKSEVINGKPCVRDDLDIVNEKGLKMKCSFFHFDDKTPHPTIIYLHGNASYRGEGAQYADNFLFHGYNIFVFDFIGCGLSDGDYITLGYKEHHDLKFIINYLKTTGLVSKIFLYGRSMGAATSLLYASHTPDPIVAGIILDSPFARFTDLFKDIAGLFGVPEFFVAGFYNFVKAAIQEKQGFNVEDLNPVQGVENVKLPALFIHASNDTLIPAKHSKTIYDLYGGPKELVNFVGYPPNNAHNAPRPPEVKEKMMNFLLTHLK